MATSDVQELLSRVRNRLWYTQFAGAVRHAMWASAALIMLAVAVHLSARHVPVAAVLLALSVLWVALLLRAGWQRPDASACALWADRHLGGTSAFTTLLELNSGKQRHASAPALRWLESWAMAKVPDSLGHLAQRRESMRLSRPLLVMLVCAALATIVLALPHTVPESRQQAAGVAAIRHRRRANAGCATARICRTGQRDRKRVAIGGIARQARAARGRPGASDGARQDRRGQGTLEGPGRKHANR